MKNQIFNLMDGTTPLYPDDPAVTPIVADAVAVANELGSVVLGTATADFGRAVASNPVGAPSFPENRGGESTLGNLVADVQLLGAQRRRHPRRRHRVHEPGRPARRPGVGRGDLQGGGRRPAVRQHPGDAGAHGGADQAGAGGAVAARGRVATVPQARHQQGVHLHLRPDRCRRTSTSPRCGSTGPSSTRRRPTKYLIGANSFLASGGDNFFTLAQGTNKADSGKIDLEAMVDYFDEFGTVSPDLAQRAVGVRVLGDGDATRRASR